MRITFILPHAGLAGGIRVVAEYAKRLHDRGHRVVVVSTSWRVPTLRQRFRLLRHGHGWQRKPLSSHFDGLEVEHRIIERFRPIVDSDVPDADVVIATWWETAEWVARLSREKGAKVYFVQHDERVMRPGDPEYAKRVAATWHLPLRKITICQWIVDLLKADAGEEIDLVGNSVNHELFHAVPRGKQPRSVVGLMYDTSSFKGADISTKAIMLAQKAFPGLRVVAYGNRNPVRELPIPPDTEYYREPPQQQLREIYAKCDAWLFGSRCEGFGLPILEAMACRTPVIGTPAGAAPELLGQGGGILVKAESPADMATAIERIIRMSNDEWKKLSDAAHTTATRYTWDDATDLFEGALKKAVARGCQGALQASSQSIAE